jgi:DNA-binding response OmpR family regulator
MPATSLDPDGEQGEFCESSGIGGAEPEGTSRKGSETLRIAARLRSAASVGDAGSIREIIDGIGDEAVLRGLFSVAIAVNSTSLYDLLDGRLETLAASEPWEAVMSETGIIAFRGIVCHSATRLLQRGSASVRLTAAEHRTFLKMMEVPGRIYHYDELVDEDGMGQGLMIRKIVAKRIRGIRRRCAAVRIPNLIRTERNIGYGLRFDI